MVQNKGVLEKPESIETNRQDAEEKMRPDWSAAAESAERRSSASAEPLTKLDNPLIGSDKLTQRKLQNTVAGFRAPVAEPLLL